MPDTRKRTAIMISGRGSNMTALIDAARSPQYPAEIVLVISNRPEAPGLAHAQQQGIATLAIDHKACPNRQAHEEAIHQALVDNRIELVCLAGYMRILSPEFVARWPGKILNIHPSLLPKFPGLDTHQRALDAGEKVHGCTVHRVTGELDAGPIVLQEAIAVAKDDDAESLAKRVLSVEHKLYPKALALVAGASQ